MTSNIINKTCCLSRILQHRSYKATQTCQILSRQLVQQNKANADSTVNEYHANRFTNELKVWWEPNGIMKLLHAYQTIRVPFIRDALVNAHDSQTGRTIFPLTNKKILDVGCGGGILSESLAKLGAQVTGIDVNQHLVELAQVHAEQNEKLPGKPTYLHTTIEEHSAQRQGYYDCVVASEVIEHVDNKELFVKCCAAALKPGGKVIITTPNRTNLTRVFGIWMAENILKLVPKGAHDYHMMITPQELTFLLERNNCQVDEIYGIAYNIFTNKFSFVKTQQLLYAVRAVKHT